MDHMLKQSVHLLVLLSVLLTACVTQPPIATPPPAGSVPTRRTLTVFAAASLMDAFKEIGRDFEARTPGVNVTFNFAGSQTLRTQLEQGAVADIFASANHTEMDKVIVDGLIVQGTPQDFLTNVLTVILPAENPANIQTLHDLARPGLKLVLADAAVPAGKYARQILDNLDKDPAFAPDFGTQVLANVASNEIDVKQVVAKVQLGEADAGIVYLTDAIAAPELKRIEIPPEDNVIAHYPIAALVKAPEPDLARSFITFVLSSEGQAILTRWGFTPIHP